MVGAVYQCGSTADSEQTTTAMVESFEEKPVDPVALGLQEMIMSYTVFLRVSLL